MVNTWTAPAALNEPTPRRVAMKTTLKVLILFITTLFLIPFIFMVNIQLSSIKKAEILRINGQEVNGKITKTYIYKNKSNETYYIQYS